MTNDLVNMKAIQEKISERIKVSFFEMLPDEEFNRLVDKELKAFFENPVESFSIITNGYGNNATVKYAVSPFSMIIHNQVKQLLNDKISKFLNDDFGGNSSYYDDSLGGYRTYLSQVGEERLKKYALDMAASMFSSMFSQAMDKAKYELQNSLTIR